jgi:hypothetical protein
VRGVVPILLDRVAAFCTLRPMHKHLACLLLLTATTAGCQVKPGEYRIYRLAGHEVSAVCTPADDPDTDHTVTATYFSPGLIAIYAADADTYFLEGPDGNALLGSRDGTGYTFTGNLTQVDNWKTADGFSRNFTATLTEDTVYDLELKGKGLTGTVTFTQVQQCGGSTDDCELANAVAFSCEYIGEVFGSEVNDVDIEYVINGGGGPVGP